MNSDQIALAIVSSLISGALKDKIANTKERNHNSIVAEEAYALYEQTLKMIMGKRPKPTVTQS